MPPEEITNLPGLKIESQSPDQALEGFVFGEPEKDSATSLTLPSEPKTEIGMIDTSSAISQVNEQKTFLDETFPENQFAPTGQQIDPSTGTPIPSATPPPPPERTLQDEIADARKTGRAFTTEGGKVNFVDPEKAPKALFVNDEGVEASFSQEELNTPDAQNFLREGGFVLSSTEGALPGGVTVDPEAQRLKEDNQQASQQVEDITQDFLDFNIDQDPDFQAQATGIKAQFDKLRRNMDRVNQARERAFETRGARTGLLQFGGNLLAGILGEELRQGSERIAEITRQESATLSAARSAFQNNKFLEFSQKVDALRDIRDQKAKALEDYNQSLIDANKAIQDQESMQLERDKFAFDILKFETEQAGLDIGTVAPGTSIFDKRTGEIIGTAPEPENTDAPEIQELNGVDMQWNPIDKTWETPTGALASALSGASEDAKNWANLITSGQAKLTEIKDGALRSQVVGVLNNTPPKQADITEIETKIKDLTDLIGGQGIIKAVGTNFLARIKLNPLSFDDKAQKNNFIATIEQLVGQTALDALIQAKAEGATFGALSEGELQLLKNSSLKFGNWARDTDGDGITDFYEISEELFEKELKSVIKNYETLIEKEEQKGLSDATKAIDKYLLDNPDQYDNVERVELMTHPDTGQPLTDEQKAQMLNISGFGESPGFNNELQTSSKGVLGLGQITGFGSPLWKHGLDIDLKIGDPVPSPTSGRVVFASNKGGFGKQVQIETSKGNKVWLSHLDSFNVKVGDRIKKGDIIGKGGNTGRTIPGAGGDGSHLDLTVKKKDGTFYTPEEIFKILA